MNLVMITEIFIFLMTLNILIILINYVFGKFLPKQKKNIGFLFYQNISHI